jgi:putative DNA primase/helicase
MPDLATPEGQARVESCLDDVALVILDNLSALCRSGKENEGEGWLPVQEWALRLRQRGIAVLFVHHAGKGGAQRGTSRREDVLDLVLALRRPTDYSPAEGLRCELHFEKCRSLIGDAAKPFEVKLQADSTGIPVWTVRPIENALLSRAAELFKDGVSVRDAAEELGISRSKAQRLKEKLRRTADLE